MRYKCLVGSVVGMSMLMVGATSALAASEVLTIDNLYDVTTPAEALSSSSLGIRFVSPFRPLTGDLDDNATYMGGVITPLNMRNAFGHNTDTASSAELIGIVDTQINNIIEKTGLCTGAGDASLGLMDPGPTSVSDPAAGRLHHCARYHPDQFSALSNMIGPYMEWRQSETNNILKIYLAKLDSPKLVDRIEGRLMMNCIKSQYGTVDGQAATASNADEAMDIGLALSACSNPQNWNVNTIFASTTGPSCNGQNVFVTEDKAQNSKNTNYLFTLPNFVTKCLFTEEKILQRDTAGNGGVGMSASFIPYGTLLALDMSPYIELGVSTNADGAAVVIKSYPMSVSVDRLYDTLFLRAYNIISTEWFANAVSGGWFPSPFAPSDIWTKNAKLLADSSTPAGTRAKAKTMVRQYSSIYFPPNLMNKIASSGPEHAPFYWRLIAQKIATIQSLEILHGSTMILQESLRVVNTADRDLGALLAPSVEYMQIVSAAYKDSIDLVQTSKLESILASAEAVVAGYQQNTKALEKNITTRVDELEQGVQSYCEGNGWHY